MRSPNRNRRKSSPRLAGLAAIVAVVVALTGFEASAHGHVPAKDGWHDTTPHGTGEHRDGLDSCSICRLAHETSSGPVSLGTAPGPLGWGAPTVPDQSALTFATPPRKQQPRAPPCIAFA